ncbi:MAG: c-type cytochrome [Anaerolineales bacterium]
MKLALAFASAGFLLSACTLSLAGDISPPPETASEQSVQILLPAAPPDLETGALIYAENCAPCHGIFGLGDGAQGAQLPFPPAALADPQVAGDASPEDWFQVISGGNLNRYMPPFSGSLSSQEIWDVIAYAFSLGWDEDRLVEGAQIYAENQPSIEENSLDPGDLEQFSQLSKSDISTEISAILPVLEPLEVETLVEYLQAVSLGYSLPDESQAINDVEHSGTISGRILNGSGSPLPGDLEVVLRSHLGGALDVVGTARIDSGGAFLFENLPLEGGRAYFVQVEYDELFFFSDLETVKGNKTSFDLPVTIYDRTSDTSELVVEYIHFVLDFPQPGVMRVVEQIGISNTGKRAVAPTADGQPVLHFTLPRGASHLEFSEGALGDRYIGDSQGFGDLRALMPGENSYQILFAYDLPYKSAANVAFPVDLPTRSVIAFIPETDIQLTENSFQLIGKQAIEGEEYLAYAAQEFASGDVIRLELSGRHPLGAPGFYAHPGLLFGLGALTAAVGIGWLWLRLLPDRRASTPNQIMDQIIDLDDAFESGQLSKAEHKRRRSSLKKQLKDALKDQS